MPKNVQSLVSQSLIILFLSSCATYRSTTTCSRTAHNQDLKQAITWYRTSAEQSALYHQTYSAGTRFIQDWVRSHQPAPKSWGVVLDIDETVLDNSWYYQQCMDVTDNEADFSRLISLAKKSLALPGAVQFTRRVHQLGGYVTFISNRDGSYGDENANVMEATLENLRQQQIYFDQLILANYARSKDPKDKNPRFNAVRSGHYDAENMVFSEQIPPHEIVAYFGDNIQDFPQLTQKSMRALKHDDAAFTKFNTAYFILPNPMYGSWQAN